MKLRTFFIAVAASGCTGIIASGQQTAPPMPRWMSAPIVVPAKRPLADLVAQSKPAVVALTVTNLSGQDTRTATGFFVAPDRIVTCFHVANGADLIIAERANGSRVCLTEIVAWDQDADLAILSCETPLDPPQPWESCLMLAPAPPREGDPIFVIGTPHGLQQTVSNGIVSSIRDEGTIRSAVQFTAPISPGSSGSPLIDSSGAVVGVVSNLWIGGQNLNFASPVGTLAGLRKEGPGFNPPADADEAVPLRVSPCGMVPVDLSWWNYLRTHPLQKSSRSALGEGQRLIAEELATRRLHPKWDLAEREARLERMRRAESLLSIVTQKQPTNACAWYTLACSRIYQSRNVDVADDPINRSAIEAMREAVRLDPKYAEAWEHLSVLYMLQHRTEEERDALNHLTEIPSADMAAFERAAGAYSRLGRKHEAIKAMVSALAVAPQPEIPRLNDKLGWLRYDQALDCASNSDLPGLQSEYAALKQMGSPLAASLEQLLRGKESASPR